MNPLNRTPAERRLDAATALELLTQRWGERDTLMILTRFRRLDSSRHWRETYATATGRQPIESDRLEMLARLTQTLQSRSKRGTLPRTHFPDVLTIRSVVCHLLDANSIVALALDDTDEAMSEALTELLATELSPELRLVRILRVRGYRREILDAIRYHHECWMATREDEAAA